MFVPFSTLLHLQPLRFYHVGGCWIESRKVATSALAVRVSCHSATSHPQDTDTVMTLIQYLKTAHLRSWNQHFLLMQAPVYNGHFIACFLGAAYKHCLLLCNVHCHYCNLTAPAPGPTMRINHVNRKLDVDVALLEKVSHDFFFELIAALCKTVHALICSLCGIIKKKKQINIRNTI